jgi:addiction module RelE/StbE family toxin
MAFNVKLSKQAEEDLSAILQYISDELFNLQAASNFFEAVIKKIGQLQEHPFMFPLYHEEKLSAKGYRYAVIGNYLMFYIIDDDTSVVSIARILYGRHDIPSVFSQTSL